MGTLSFKTRNNKYSWMLFPIRKKVKQGYNLVNQRRGRDSEHNSGHTEERVVYWGEYQNKTCQHTNNHSGQFYGQKTQIIKICAACRRMNKLKEQHPKGIVCLPISWIPTGINKPGPLFTNETPSYRYRDPHYKPKPHNTRITNFRKPGLIAWWNQANKHV